MPMNNVCYFINFDSNLTMTKFHAKNVNLYIKFGPIGFD